MKHAIAIASVLLLIFMASGCSVDPLPYRKPQSNGGLRAVDQILESLEFGTIVFNTPSTINLYDTVVIELVLGLNESVDELSERIEAVGELENECIKVSERMKATLLGQNFSITAITSEKQVVSASETTKWKWQVQPNSAGRHKLHLTVSVLLRINNESTPRAIRTFAKEIEVEVTWRQRIASFLGNYWQWLCTAILFPILFWLWNRRRRNLPCQ